MPYLRKYNAATNHATHIRIPMIQAGANDFAHSGHWTPVSGDVLVQTDGDVPATAANLLPIYSGCSWAFRFTADELQGKTITVCIQDSATKAVEDQFFSIETYGDNNAMHKMDYGSPLWLGNTPAEITSVPPASSTIHQMLQFMFAMARQAIDQSTNNYQILYADDGTTPIASSYWINDGTTQTRQEWTKA